jgi:hypothetical protein
MEERRFILESTKNLHQKKSTSVRQSQNTAAANFLVFTKNIKKMEIAHNSQFDDLDAHNS